MDKEVAIGFIGTALSVIVVIVGYLIDNIVLQVVFSFLSGAFSTYLIQHWLQIETERRTNKRENHVLLRDKIFGPLYEAFNIALDRLDSGEEMIHNVMGAYSPIHEIKQTVDNYYFLLTEKEEQEIVNGLYSDLVEYNLLYGKAEEAIYDIVSAIIHEKYPEANVLTTSTYFTLRDHRTPAVDIILKNALLTKTNPFNEFRKKVGQLENPIYDIRFPGTPEKSDPETAEKMFMAMLEKGKQEKRLITYWEKRKALQFSLKKALPTLRKKVEW